MKFLAAIALPLYALDQWTKWLTITAEQRGDLPHVVIPPQIFMFVYWQNTGAAFSLGDGNNWFFIVLSVAAFIGLLIAWRRDVFADRPSRWAVALLLSGIMGNVTDRILHGHVVDMLLFDFGFKPFHPWPAFNVADSCICIAVGLFLWASFFPPKKASVSA
jgi:signal peptidase II